MALPVAFLEENRMFTTNGKAFAVYVVSSQSYAFQPQRVKQRVIDRFIHAVSNLTGDFSLYLLTKQLSVTQIMNNMQKFSSHPRWIDHMNYAEQQLLYNLPYTRINLLVIPLKIRKFNLKFEGETIFQKLENKGKQVIHGFFDVRDKFFRDSIDIPLESLEDARRQASDAIIKLTPFGRIRPASLSEVEWYLKKPYFRGLPDPDLTLGEKFPSKVITRAGKTLIRPTKSSTLTIADVIGEETFSRYKFHHDELSISHQTFYTTVEVPNPIPENDSTGFEWLYGLLENLEFPVDVALHVKVEPPKEADRGLRKKKGRAEQQHKEWSDNDQDTPLELEEVMETVPALEKKLRAKQPLLHVHTVFALGSNDENQLLEDITEFKENATKFHKLIHSPGDMRRLFQAFYPFAQEPLPEEWAITMDPGVLAAAVPLGTRSLGDHRGFWLGRLGNDRPVFMDPRRPAQELNKTGAIMIVGDLGSGKSVLMKLLSYHLLLWGAVGFIIDPKGEYYGFLQIPDVGHEVKLVEFTDSSKTQFTPFRLGTTQSDSAQAAFAILELILNPYGTEIRNIVLNNALEMVYKTTQWDMHTFMQCLEHYQKQNEKIDPEYSKEAKIVNLRLKQLEHHSLGSVLFGKDTGSALFDKRMLVAVVRGLTLPQRGTPKREWSDGERISAALLFSVATVGLRQLMSIPGLKFISLDEEWVLREFEQGAKLLNEMLRLSRSLNLIPIFASQNPTDFLPREGEEDITGLFSWKFIYRLNSLTQVEAALSILGMTEMDAEDWMSTFSESYQNGFGLVKDAEGRIGELQVELIDDRLWSYFNSTPPDVTKGW